MKFALTRSLAVLAGACVIGAAQAQPVINGQITEPAYGLPIALQTIGTQFGDNSGVTIQGNGGPIPTAGSEVAGMFVYSDGTYVYVGLTGNLEDNFNKFPVWFDTKAGGQNQLIGPYGNQPDFGNYRFYVDPAGGNGPGMRFDAGFAADYMVAVQGGGPNPGGSTFSSYWNLPTDPTTVVDNLDLGRYLGSGSYGGTGSISFETGVPAEWLGYQLSIDNSNSAGVTNSDALGAAAVTTGVEMRIPIAALGGDVSNMKIFAIINGGSHDFFSNQMLPAPSDSVFINNLGAPHVVDFAGVVGQQWAQVLPSVSGSMIYGAGMGTLDLPVKVQWYDLAGNLLIDGGTILPGAGIGSYKVSGPGRGGNFRLRLTPKGYLPAQAVVNTTTGAITGVNFSFIPGNADGDFQVGPADFSTVLAAFGSEAGDPGYNAAADIDNDGQVGPSDFTAVLTGFGSEFDG